MKKFSLLLVLFAMSFIFMGCEHVPAPRKMIKILPEPSKGTTTKSIPLNPCTGSTFLNIRGTLEYLITVQRKSTCNHKDLRLVIEGMSSPFYIYNVQKGKQIQDYLDQHSKALMEDMNGEPSGRDHRWFYQEYLQASGGKNAYTFVLIPVPGTKINGAFRVHFEWTTATMPAGYTKLSDQTKLEYNFFGPWLNKKVQATCKKGKSLRIEMALIMTHDIDVNYMADIIWVLGEHKENRQQILKLHGSNKGVHQSDSVRFLPSEVEKYCKDGKINLMARAFAVGSDLPLRFISYKISWVDPQ